MAGDWTNTRDEKTVRIEKIRLEEVHMNISYLEGQVMS